MKRYMKKTETHQILSRKSQSYWNEYFQAVQLLKQQKKHMKKQRNQSAQHSSQVNRSFSRHEQTMLIKEGSRNESQAGLNQSLRSQQNLLNNSSSKMLPIKKRAQSANMNRGSQQYNRNMQKWKATTIIT